MNPDREIDIVLSAWLEDGPSGAPDRVLDVLTDRIARQPQRPAWRLDWRQTTMQPAFKVGVGIAAVLLIAVVGWNLLPASQSGTGGPGTTATPTLSPSPSTSAAPLPYPEAILAPGRYFVLAGPHRVSFEVLAGWRLTEKGDDGLAFVPVAGPDGDTVRVFYDMRPASRDEHCLEVPEPGSGPAAHDVISGVASTPGVVAAPVQPTTIGTLQGEVLDVSMSPSWTHACPFSSGQPTVPLIVDTITTAEGPFWGLGPNEKERLVGFDVPGWSNVIIVVDSADGLTFDALAAQAMAFIETLEVT